jgi:hypothetical protein
MKAPQFSEAQKAFILKQGRDGMPVAEICRKAGISQATYFNGRKKCDGLLPAEMSAEAARGREQQATARGCRSQPRQGDAAGRQPAKTLRLVRKCKLVDEVRGDWNVSIRRACRVLLFRHVELPLQVSSPRAGGAQTTDQGDLPDAGTLWLSATCSGSDTDQQAAATGVGATCSRRHAADTTGLVSAPIRTSA